MRGREREEVEAGKAVLHERTLQDKLCLRACICVCYWFVICVCAKSGCAIFHGCDGQCSLCHPDTISTALQGNGGRLHVHALFIYLCVRMCVYHSIGTAGGRGIWACSCVGIINVDGVVHK